MAFTGVEAIEDGVSSLIVRFGAHLPLTIRGFFRPIKEKLIEKKESEFFL